MNLAQKIEAILFWKAEPVTFDRLATWLAVDPEDIRRAIGELSANLSTGGLALVVNDDEVMLGTNKEASALIESITKDEISRDLGKAGLETLSIVLYQGPISRADLDYIRGVSSQFIVRNLLIRGLIERVDNPDDARVFLYRPSLALLAHLGVSRVEDLPEYKKVRADIEGFKKSEIEASRSNEDQQ